ncbi:uncharacterized protein TNCV_5071451 [Trichonephila clavipes]|nr:uncharacterized protein TNCV_5071451 [Trichonephila clavipes]
MSLHKGCFSHSTNDFPHLHFDQSEESITKTLGVLWNSSSDTFCFKSFSLDQSYPYEERSALPDRTDSSEKGFCDVTYVSVIKNNGDRHSQLLCSKSRVAPLKTNHSQIRATSMPSTFHATGNSNLTLEEFITLFAEIEAVLNSRPLSPLSSDFETLTPGHFLIGRPVTTIVEPN